MSDFQAELRELEALSGATIREADEDFHRLADAAIGQALHDCGAQFGITQHYNISAGALVIASQRNFRIPFLKHFSTSVPGDGTVHGRAFESRSQVAVEDVRYDPDYAPHLPVAEEAGFRAVLSTPVPGADNAILGVLSVYYAKPHHFTPEERQAAQKAACNLGRQWTGVSR
ncbi:GAF domain-containing protein [Devosia sp. PTR5]|uniref:GAF domain-containing protein n=1 Tax=Devosia oryzisoli TaxID=2774138 RepID=A0A927IS31_9HYPH|nr:GAF domain-containing protein [Devosia oryzisoli]MBD8064412.1 GAF domain-containing protein [Devosia oryzisoli]